MLLKLIIAKKYKCSAAESFLSTVGLVHLRINRHNGRQMSSLFTLADSLFDYYLPRNILSWMEIPQLILLGEIHENVQNIKYMSNTISSHLSWWSYTVVECKASYHKVTGSNSPYISMGSYLKLCLTITPPSPSTRVKS